MKKSKRGISKSLFLGCFTLFGGLISVMAIYNLILVLPITIFVFIDTLISGEFIKKMLIWIILQTMTVIFGSLPIILWRKYRKKEINLSPIKYILFSFLIIILFLFYLVLWGTSINPNP